MQTELLEGYRISPQQEHLWLVQNADHASAYFAKCAVRIEGPLVVEVFKQALAEVATHNEILRTTFHVLPSLTLPVQIINDVGPRCEQIDLSDITLIGQADYVKRFYEENLFETQSLFQLARLSSSRHVLFIRLPSLCADTIGLQNLVREISATYAACRQGAALEHASMQYADAAEVLYELLESEETAIGRQHWLKQDYSFTAQLPFERKPGNNIFDPRFFTITLHLEQIKAHEGSVSDFLLTCWYVLLARLTQETDVTIATGFDGRNYEELQSSLGLFARYLPGAIQLDESSTFTEVLEKVQQSQRELSDWQEYFSWELLGESVLQSSAPVFCPFAFDFSKQPAKCDGGEVSFSIYEQYACIERFKLKLSIQESEDTVSAEFHFDSELFALKDIERLAGEFCEIVKSAIANPAAPVGQLNIMSAAEEREQLQEWNRTAVTVRAESVVESFERCAAEMRDAVAVSFADEQVSYGELNERASKLAGELRRLGVGVESRVGILLERSVEMVVAVLGVLKSGGAYVPLEPEYPRARLSYLCEDAGLAVIISVSELVQLLPAGETRLLLLDEEWPGDGEQTEVRVEAENLAYMLYTSGSTGMPKGVMVRHGSLSNHMQWMQQRYALQAGDCVLQKTPLSFDASVWEFLAPLLAGARLEIARAGGHRESGYLVETIKRAGVTVLQVVPSQLRMLLGEAEFGRCGTLRRVFYGGAAISGTLAAEFQRRVSAALINLYGPTETTIEVTSWRYGGEVREAEVLPIGEPIWNTQVYVLSEGEQLLPAGAKGELYVGGVSLARGYHQRPELTAERFVPDGVSGVAGARLYRTGDVGRYVGAGVLECLGRADEQVKVRGYRVELGEIEATLQRHAGIREAVVLTRVDESGEQHLVACVVEEGKGAGEWRSLQEWLKEQLPHYMVPSSYVKLEELPLLVNGKVDRQQLAVLAEAGQQQQAAGPARQEPLSPVEQILAGIWREVLGVKEVGRDDNFFDLGGHSLLATQLLSRVRKTFEIDLALLKLYESSTLASLAQTVATELRKGTQSLQAPPMVKRKSDGELLLSFAQQRLWFIDQLESNNTAYNTPAALRLTGRLNVAALRQAMGVVVQRHEMLRTSFHMFAGRPVQVIASPAPLPMLFSDLSGLTEAEREGEVRRLALVEAWRPFDLTQAPLLRLSLIRISAEEHLFVVVMHHIVADGWSMAVLISEVESLYKAFVEGEAVALPELPVQYADYSVWQREWLKGEVLEEQLNYWRNQLAGAPEELGLPTDKPRPAVTSYRGSHQDLTIPAELAQQLRDVSRREGITLFMLLLAVFQVLLSRYSAEEDVCVGSPIAGRNQLETEGLIGFFVNTLVLRTRIRPHETFRGLLQQVRKTCLGAYEHQELPFERLVEELQPERDLGRAPVVQVMFNLLNVKRATVKQSVNLPGVSWTPAGLGSETAKVDLDVSVAETEEGLRITLGYSTDLYEGNTIEQMGRYFASLLEAAAADPTQKLSTLVSNVPKQKLSIAIASTFTADPVQESLSFCLRALNIPNKIELAAYDQVFQQLLDPSSTLRRNEDGTNIILLRVEDWLQDLRRNVEEFCASLAAAAKETTATYLIGVCPSADPQNAAAGLELQTSLTANLQTQRGVSLIDLSDVATKYKIAEIYNPYTDNLAHIPFTEEFFAALGAVLARRIYNSLSSPYKVVVLDCDNTLWGGVCGEEGPQGIQLNHGFQSLQQFMAHQSGAGRLLALCSKNNEEDVMQVFQNRRDMTLQLHQFTAWKINWELKSQNLRALSSELQLPLDSFIFIDDDVVECAEVRADCPDVLTLQLPKNAADYPEFLDHVWAFDQLNVTEADKQRSTIYQQNRERERFQSEYPTLEQFLNDLKLEIRIARATSDQLERVAQLSQRTNQFNATVIRRTTGDIEQLLEIESTECWVVEVSDRFGDYGLVGAMIFDVSDAVLRVDSFLLSCRALGRKVEDNMLIELLRIARERNCREVQLAFRRTAKNVPAYNFFSRIAIPESDANPIFVFDVERILDSTTLVQSNYGSHFAGEFSPAPQADSLTISETTSLLSLQGPAKSELMNRIAAEFQTGSAILTAMRAGQKRVPSRRSEEYVAPRTDTEEVVAEIWAEVLGVEKVGVKDNFFALGGHSLMATQLLSRIREIFRVDLPLRTMFATPTVLGLVDALTLAYGESNTLEDIAQLVKQLREMSEEDLSAMLTTA